MEHVAGQRRDGGTLAVQVQDQPGASLAGDLVEAPVCFLAYDATGTITYAGGSGWAGLRLDPAASVGRSMFDAYGDDPQVREGIERCLAGYPDERVLEYGGRVWDLHHRPTHDASGRPAGGMCMAHDVTSWSLPATGSERDSLTQVLSQSAVERRLAMGRTTALLVVDLEAFRAVNDVCGRAGGDRVLTQVAGRLVRVAGTWEVGRWSGDVFVLLTDEDRADAAATTSAVVGALDRPVVVAGRELHLGATVSAVTSPPVSASRLVLQGLLAVRTAKQAVRAPATSSPRPPADADPRLAVDVAAELRTALDSGQLLLHFQPVVRLAGSVPVGVEALVRWQHPTRGLLRPGAFLDLAERSGLVVPLGEHVLREACVTAAAWRRRFPEAELRVAVNLSARQLFVPDAVGIVREALRQASCPSDALVLEVSEVTAGVDVDEVSGALADMRALGVRVVVDGAGTGWSSSSYLGRLPVDMLKIDRSVVAALGPERRPSALLSSLVALARRSGIGCLAAGIETLDQLEVLRDVGCTLGQGYVFRRPADRDTTVAWLERALRPERAARDTALPPSEDTVRRTLELQDEGASLHTIAARLNLEGRRTAVGRRWHHTSVAQLLAAQPSTGGPA